MKGSERVVSEAELRVRRSLQRLHVPEWMKNAPPAEQSFLLKKSGGGGAGGGAGGGGGGGWAAYSSKAGSMTSLGSTRSGHFSSKVVIPTRVTSSSRGFVTSGAGMTSSMGGGGMMMTSPYGMTSSMTSPSSASVSPSPSDKISLFTYPSGRWSSSRLNSGNVTPTGSVRTLGTPTSLSRTPYLGWRSQTSLARSQTSLSGSQTSILGSYMTPAERLALGVTSYSFLRKKEEGEGGGGEGEKEKREREEKEGRTREDGERDGKAERQSDDEGRERETQADKRGNGRDGGEEDVHSSIREVTSAIVHYCKDSSPSPRATRGQRSRPVHPPPPVPSRTGQDRSRSPVEGQEDRSRSPFESQARSRSPAEGQERSNSALDDQERLFNLESQVEGQRRSLTPLEGQLRSNSPLGGQMRSNSPLGGQLRSNSPLGGQIRSNSPRRLVWVESSFVGSRPIHSPETPTASTHALATPTPTSEVIGSGQVNGDGSGQVRMEEESARRPESSTPGEYLMAW
ncbi:serine/arginine repetitive matrix protein 2-like [Penaeus indicus]|uniref:serine/arginine repetitive matrix protein 2-like n=1 Tax=Penaeus indicus TaxID=29960 RepID=UPI00300CCC23